MSNRLRTGHELVPARMGRQNASLRSVGRRDPTGSGPSTSTTRGGKVDESQPPWELHRTDRPRDHDTAVLERLAEAFDGVAGGVGEFVEEQHAMMHECAGMSPEALHQVEGRRVAEPASYRGVVSGKSPDLEEVTQLRVRGFDTESLREGEPKTGVVLGRS